MKRHIKLRTYPTPRDFCPHCGHEMDAASSFHRAEDGPGGPPQPGHLSVCIECMAFLRWHVDAPGRPMMLVPLPSFEGLPLDAVNRLLELRAALKLAKAYGPPTRQGAGKKEVKH